MKSASLWNYYRDEVNDDANENNSSTNYRINNNKTTARKFFEYKTEYFSNFWRSSDLPLINCET